MEEDEEGEEGEEDDEGMIIDLDKLDETNKQMLLEYLQEQYEKNPG
jgi:6-pyruvoyl-tetrahydropterin synthase